MIIEIVQKGSTKQNSGGSPRKCEALQNQNYQHHFVEGSFSMI